MAYESLDNQKIRGLADDELVTLIGKLRDELFGLRNRSVSEKVEDVSHFGKMKKDIARLKTEQSSRRAASADA